MKIEFLYQYHRRRRRSAREALVAHLPRYAPWLARLAPLANLRDRVPGLAMASEKLLGLSAKRTLPVWRRDFFRGQSEVPSGGNRGEVVLLADTFNTYFEPENLRAAVRVLVAAGYRIEVAAAAKGRPLCCGRTYLAAGMIDEARAEARRMRDALAPHVERGRAIVGLEPACLLGLRDELLRLLPGAASNALAGAALTFEEFLAREQRAGSFELKLQKPSHVERALVHGHCHQKAFDAMPAVTAVLELVPGLRVQTIASSCCGMAGAFGYGAEHLAVSLKMAESALLPAVRAASSDTVIVADGTSCRHQIRDGAQRDALHVARILASALAAA
jgi:Fe-S oxidoreductase